MRLQGYSEYKPIRNDIRNFDPEKLLFLVIHHLHQISRIPAYDWAKKGMSPWELMLFVKWIYFESHQAGKEVPTYRDFARIVNKIKDLFDDLGVPEGTPFRIEKYMRKTAFQQFWFQHALSYSQSGFGRTIELFLKMPCEYDLDGLLINEVGITKNEFFDFSFIAWIKLNSMEHKVRTD